MATVTLQIVENNVTLAAITSGGGPGPSVGQNVGAQAPVFKDNLGSTMRFRTLRGVGGVAITQNGDVLDIGVDELDYKQSVRAATTAPITLSGLQTVDGVALLAGDRVLVKNQAAPAQNGLYAVAVGAWTRTTDADTNPEVTAGLVVGVEEGTANGDKAFILATNTPIVLGTTPLTFVNFGFSLSDITDGDVTFKGAITFRPDDVYDVLKFDEASIANLEPVPITVRYFSRLEPAPLGAFAEATAVYARHDPVGGPPQQRYAFYGEITGNQADATHGALFKIVHAGHGDAIVVNMFGSGAVAFEAASHADTTKGIISTLQGDFPNSVLFNALHDQPTVPNFGMYYADQSPGHALTIRKRLGANDGFAQIRVVENDFARNRFSVFNGGQVFLESLPATALATLRESPEFKLRGAYWTGAASQDRDVILKHVVTAGGGSPASELRAFIGDTGGEVLAAMVEKDGNFRTSYGAQAVASGIQSTAIGRGANAPQLYSTALGEQSNASADSGTALGRASQATGLQSTALGRGALATADQTLAAGVFANAATTGATALGHLASVGAGLIGGTAIGQGATITGNSSVAIGNGALSTVGSAVAVGYGASVSGTFGIAIGASSSANGTNATVVGMQAGSAQDNATLVGRATQVQAMDGIAIGAFAEVRIGGTGGAIAIGKSVLVESDQCVAIGSTIGISRARSVIVGIGCSVAGSDQVAIGHNAVSSGGIAIGSGVTAGSGSVAIAGLSGSQSIAIGLNSTALGSRSTAVGSSAVTGGSSDATAIGRGTTCSAIDTTALGVGASASSTGAQALGRGALASGADTLAAGRISQATAASATALGTDAQAMAAEAAAVGHASRALGVRGTAIGKDATVSAVATSGVAVGYSADANSAGSVAVGPNALVGIGFDSGVAVGDQAVVSGTAGVAIGTQTDATATGAVAVGAGAQATAGSTVAIGDGAQAGTADSIAIGHNVNLSSGAATGCAVVGTLAGPVTGSSITSLGVGNSIGVGVNNVTAIGAGVTANAAGATGVGRSAAATGAQSTAVGNGAAANGSDSTAIGQVAQATSPLSTALGQDAEATGVQSTSIGALSRAATINSVAVGEDAQATGGSDGTCVGASSRATSSNGVAVGKSAQSTAAGAVALGWGAVASHADSIAIGNSAITSGIGLGNWGSASVPIALRTFAGVQLPTTTKTAAYTATKNDHTILADATAGAFTVTLPPAASFPNLILTVKKIDATGNAVTIDGDGAETIDGAATQSLAAQWNAKTVQSDGAAWFITATV